MNKFLKELQNQSKTALPAIVGLLCYRLPWMISLHFVGMIGAKELAAAALASSLCNVTGLSLAIGLSSALMTLAGQARGHLLKLALERGESVGNSVGNSGNSSSSSTTKEDLIENEISPLLKNEEEIEERIDINSKQENKSSILDEATGDESPLLPLVFLYRGLIIQFGFVIPVGLWWISGIEPVLLYFGQSEELSKMTSTYLRILTPGLWCFSTYTTIAQWLLSIEIAEVPALLALIGVIIHIPLNILFVRILGFGYEGVAIATVSSQSLQLVMILVYVFGTYQGSDRILTSIGAKGVGRTRFNFWSEVKAAVSSLSGIKQYLWLGLPGMIANAEWW